VQFSTPKTDKGRRSVPLDGTTIEARRQHQARQEDEAVALGSGWASLDLLFCQEDGSPLNPHRFTDALDRHAHLGIPRWVMLPPRHAPALPPTFRSCNQSRRAARWR
jgi:hypothetical protein